MPGLVQPSPPTAGFVALKTVKLRPGVFPKALADSLGLKTQRRFGTASEPAARIGTNGHIMKKLISPACSPGTLTLLRTPRLPRFGVAVLLGVLVSHAVFAADFAVTSPGFFYTINGNQPNPAITLVRGQTYTFSINCDAIHPFFINSPGVQNNNISQGTITYTVPTVDSNYNYFCSIHGFGAQILTVAPAPPPAPTVRILSLAVSNIIVLHSTGTNGWSVNPQYSTNLATTNWFALSVLTNRFLDGINETICGRPPGSNVFFRIRSRPN